MDMNINEVKVRCFDAEFERDQLREQGKQVNGILTTIADRVGVMQTMDDKQVFDPNAILGRVDALIKMEGNYNTVVDDSASKNSTLEAICERLGCSVDNIHLRLDSVIEKARMYDENSVMPLDAEPVETTNRRKNTK